MKIITTLFLLAAARLSIAQGCMADAGPDRTVCASVGSTVSVQVGGNPAATGKAPFTYQWSCTFTVGMGQNTFTLTASDFLSDTTVANPTVLSPGYGNKIPLLLTVTDSAMYVCTDTVWITYSQALTHLGQYSYTVSPGDTLHFTSGPNLIGSIPPLTYKWRPNHGLLDSTNMDFKTKPLQTTSYYVVMTDAAGCVYQGSPFVFVHVTPVSVSEILHDKIQVRMGPNPASGTLKMQISGKQNENLTLQITDLTGKVVHISEVKAQEMETDISDLGGGVYVVSLKSGTEEVWRGRMIAR